MKTADELAEAFFYRASKTHKELTAAIEARDAEHGAELAKMTARLDEAMAIWSDELDRAEKAIGERDSLKAQLDIARGLLGRTVKYATEDRAVTPGVTRLERLLGEISRFLADGSMRQ